MKSRAGKSKKKRSSKDLTSKQSDKTSTEVVLAIDEMGSTEADAKSEDGVQVEAKTPDNLTSKPDGARKPEPDKKAAPDADIEVRPTNAGPAPATEAQVGVDDLAVAAAAITLPRKDRKRSVFISRRIDDVLILAALAALFTLAFAFGALRNVNTDQGLLADATSETGPISGLTRNGTVAQLHPLEQAFVAYQAGDFVSARNLWKTAAQSGDLSAQYNLGLLYAEGRGVVRNPQAAMDWWRLAAQKGHARSQHNLALALLSGESVVPGQWLGTQTKEAENLLRQAAKSDLAAADFALGLLLLETPSQLEEARQALRSGADQGHNEARLALAQSLLSGDAKGTVSPKDTRRAMVLYLQAASSGYGPAQGRLAQFYADGLHVQADLVEALAWASVAVTNGYTLADTTRRDVLDGMSDEEVALAHRRIAELAEG